MLFWIKADWFPHTDLQPHRYWCDRSMMGLWYNTGRVCIFRDQPVSSSQAKFITYFVWKLCRNTVFPRPNCSSWLAVSVLRDLSYLDKEHLFSRLQLVLPQSYFWANHLSVKFTKQFPSWFDHSFHHWVAFVWPTSIHPGATLPPSGQQWELQLIF